MKGKKSHRSSHRSNQIESNPIEIFIETKHRKSYTVTSPRLHWYRTREHCPRSSFCGQHGNHWAEWSLSNNVLTAHDRFIVTKRTLIYIKGRLLGIINPVASYVRKQWRGSDKAPVLGSLSISYTSWVYIGLSTKLWLINYN